MRGEAPQHVQFLIAGVQKAGTSALFDYLTDVPSLQLPAIKEAHFFDDERLDWAAPDVRAYHSLFACDGRLWGEATPIYCYWPNSIDRIHAYNPEMRIILIFRDPIERAWSHWKMEFAKGKETEPFAWCIREGRARLTDGDPTAPGYHRVFSYVERGFYGRQLIRLKQFFSERQCLLLRQEELDRDPNEVISRICAFLDVSVPEVTLSPRRVREAAEISYPSMLTAADRALLADAYKDDLALFADLTGWDLAGWSSEWLSEDFR